MISLFNVQLKQRHPSIEHQLNHQTISRNSVMKYDNSIVHCIVLKKYQWGYDVWHWLNLSPDLWGLCTYTILSYRSEYMSKTAFECQLSADWRWNKTSKQIALYTSPSEHTLCSQLKKWDNRDSDIFVEFHKYWVKRKFKTQFNDMACLTQVPTQL